jgi:integrase
MDRNVRAHVLLAEAESLGVSIEDLVAAAADRPQAARQAPTFAEYVTVVETVLGPGRTTESYRSYWRLAVARFGDDPIDVIGTADFDVVLADAVNRAQRARPGTDGRASRENCVAALRAVFNRAERAGLIVRNPAAALEKPRRLPSRRRALDNTELEELVEAVRTTSHDPELDLLIVRFHLESGARRLGALNASLGDLDERRATVWLLEKVGAGREQPISPSLLAALLAFAHQRGARAPEDRLLRTKRGGPIYRKHYNVLFDRAQAALPWTRRTPATAHVLRHTAGTAVERIAGHGVAEAFLGHNPSSVTSNYTKATIEEVATAIAVLTGEPHPLAEIAPARAG